jgi:hypothetical protein
MERLFFHLNKMDFRNIISSDYIGVTQGNKDYMLDAIEAAALKMFKDE